MLALPDTIAAGLFDLDGALATAEVHVAVFDLAELPDAP